MLSLLIGAVAGILIAVFCMYVAWSHNPQGEFYDTQSGNIHWLNWLGLGASWFVLAGGAFASAILIIIVIPQYIYTMTKKQT